ncbi:MAG TPA: sulfurtransferase complex subunit TusC [Anaerolineae bacterium]|nr:sulfurtransferase complex subunit TusC [Anaerolineae bacterium]HOQ97474.1 sulfurtransferase complex subunit TusC [Anaerolineae bacterium]HPL29650.1 sulfurtransferase complex subunit TusC [Anaerolineae bacterium]
MKKVLLLMRRAPYGTVYTAEGLRSVMGLGVFEMDVALVCVGDGVYALLAGQDPAALDMKPLGASFAGLGEFGVQRFYVHAPSLAERGLAADDLVVPAAAVDDAGLQRLLAEQDAVLPF